ncbi:MAG TPA: DUF3826 domain-containing protein [Chitinophagaceae bacterium]|nr:DUF3826 domain-containing protein [Chitinophagaceae bacterium]
MKRFLLANVKLLYGYVISIPAWVLPYPARLHRPALRFLISSLAFFICLAGIAQEKKSTPVTEDYKKVLRERSAKIVNTIGLTDSGIYQVTVDQLLLQYLAVNSIHDQYKAAVAELKSKSLTAETTETAKKALDEKKSSDLSQQHKLFLAQLKKNLTLDQIEQIKDGMTYRVFPITWAAYQDMLPNLKPEEKEQIFEWLKEARELAMDEGSSDDKHKVFGKYKGKINNYLSKAGYDMKKEGEEWQKRIKEKQQQKKETLQ